MDGMITKGDLDKNSSDSAKVAAGAVHMTDFLKRMSIGLSKFGHWCILMSQVREKIKGQYDKADPNGMISGSGGNAAIHFPDWILEFRRQTISSKILPDPNAKIDSQSNRPLGHMAQVLICKSDNENQGVTVQYPVKYGRVGKSAIWVERE
jgi:RecA/RadA recombinase